MIRGFNSNREERIPVSVRLSTSSKNVVDITTEAINSKFEECYIESKVTLTDVFEEIILSSVSNTQNVLQIDDQFYSISEILTSYLDEKFNNIVHLNEIISREELESFLRTRKSVKENIKNYFSKYKRLMPRHTRMEFELLDNLVDYEKDNYYEIYNTCSQWIRSEELSFLRAEFKFKTKKEIFNEIISLQQFRGIDVFLKLNKNKDLIWFNKLKKIIDSFIENVIINDKVNVFNDYIKQAYEQII